MSDGLKTIFSLISQSDNGLRILKQRLVFLRSESVSTPSSSALMHRMKSTILLNVRKREERRTTAASTTAFTSKVWVLLRIYSLGGFVAGIDAWLLGRK